MAVNLNGIDLSGAAASPARKATAANSATSGSQEATQQPSSEVSITSTASLLANLQKSLATKPAVDQDRVNAVSKALAAGTYSVNPARIAQGVIDIERALSPLK